MKRRLTVVVAPGWGEFSGYGSRELFEEVTGRPPLRNARTRRWSCSAERARDLVALAEVRGWDVVVEADDGGDGVDVA